MLISRIVLVTIMVVINHPWLIQAQMIEATTVSSTYSYPPQVSEDTLRYHISNIRPDRPRLLMNAEDVRNIRERVAKDPEHARYAAYVLQHADAILKAPPVERVLEGIRLLDQSQLAVKRMLILGMAYHLTDNQAYVQRASAEMKAIASFSDWNPKHFLDTAEMTFAMAIGYDWLYDQLDEETRQLTRQAIIDKGLGIFIAPDFNQGWARGHTNWNQVCHGGMLAGALALIQEHPDYALKTVQGVLAGLPYVMNEYAPNGAYVEGPSYWAYGTTYNVLIISMLESVLGSSFGLDLAPGFQETGSFPALCTGPSGLYFNYADGAEMRLSEPAVEWFAKRYHHPEWLYGQEAPRQRVLQAETNPNKKHQRFFSLMLLWANTSNAAGHVLPLHWTSNNKVPISIHRTSWDNMNAVYVAFKAGSPDRPHGHMDIGSFVLDADGVRWATDLGAEVYYRAESQGLSFFGRSQDSDRWKVFRQNSLSHNTLVIDDTLQLVNGDAPMIHFSAEPEFPHSVVDLSTVYANHVKTAHRGIALLPSGEVLIRDHLTGLKPGSKVRWVMVTRSNVEANNGNSLKLRQDDARLLMRNVSPDPQSWQTYDTATSRNAWDSPNPGTVMVGFETFATDSGQLDLIVVITPGSRTITPVSMVPIQAPMTWGNNASMKP
ncbi:MAG: hypothetical protein HC898_00200 [Phycisphaerales bacterium]|nr:hypothetical protein [Phycisphaerales bacterium]